MKKSWLIFLVGILLLPSFALSQETYHLKLLAVQENSNNSYTGSDADLYLELKKGSGRVFLDTFPATKVDTQISTRFAKEIACSHFKLNCDKYDFIYTINAKSNIIGGPSAGAAIAALTTIAVLDLDHDESVAITGTINSGGIIGPVGGVKEKLEAASKAGLKRVLIPEGTEYFTLDGDGDGDEDENGSEIDLVTFAKEDLSLDVLEVINLDEVVFHLTGVDLNHKDISIEEDSQYSRIMGDLQNILCKRVVKIEQELESKNIILNESLLENIEERKHNADNATQIGDYYSAASYCFGINILLKSQFYQQEAPDFDVMNDLFLSLQMKVSSLERELALQKIETISDLQTLLVVKERVDDVKQQIEKFNKDDLENSYDLLGYAEERYFSALSWMQFFAMDGKKVVFDKQMLQNSCLKKISEAEERHQYVSLFLGDLTSNIREKIGSAETAMKEGEFELCLIKALQAKGDANAIMSSMGLRDESFGDYLESKSRAVQMVIAENSAEKTFPILGYSYYQYANSLKEREKYTSLIYLEYALEMSDLSIYFPEEQTFLDRVGHKLDFDEMIIFMEGVAAGAFFVLLMIWMKKDLLGKKKKRRKKKIRTS